MDPSSHSTFNVATRHAHFDFDMNFEEKIIIGSVVLCLVAWEDASSITLDTRQLEILSVEYAEAQNQETVWEQRKLTPEEWDKHSSVYKNFNNLEPVTCSWKLGAEHASFGTPLDIKLPANLPKGKLGLLKITYKTHPSCSAAQWLAPLQTASKTHPYFFTQCQAIHARSLFPCQDTPALKFTYSASVSVPKELCAIMSALVDGEGNSDSKSVFHFKQPVPIPSYLVALAAGKLSSRNIGPRSSVWSEEETVGAGEYEFAETESFVSTAEKIVSEYVWKTYDLLLLPPSFPYGGMENPCLTFVTPTLIAGDRSLVDVVAHEISHSWAGNLVTNKNWQHFWLNEGFCVYIERKILGHLHGELVRQFKSIIGWKALKHSIDNFGADNKLTSLVVDLNGIDPDDAFSSVPYEKGYNLLYHLECVLGGPKVFDLYLKAHFKQFEYQSITTEDWKRFLYDYIGKNHPEKISALDIVAWDSWLHEPGMPPVKMPFDTTLANECQKLADKWKAAETATVETFPPTSYLNLTIDQKIVFFEELHEIPPLKSQHLEYIWNEYKISESKNAEIRFRFFQVCLKAKYLPILPRVAEFLKEQGRMKFIRPLYRSLMTFEEGKKVAKETFAVQKNLYHPIAAQMVEKDLKK